MKAKDLVKILERVGYQEVRQKGLLKQGGFVMKKRGDYANLTYSIRILNNGDRTYSVEVPKLPGCYSTGRSKEECIANIVEAIELHLEGIKNPPAKDSFPSIEVVQEGPSSEDHLISLPEACKFLDVSDATIRRYVKAGKVPAYNFGKEYKFKISELASYIISTRVQINDKPRIRGDIYSTRIKWKAES